jgi:DNA-binding PadR family transcriptional regulator
MSSNESQAHKNACTEADVQTTESAAAGAELTDFQYQALRVIVEEARYGLAIKRALEAYYGTEVNHGRLYPNLDTLVEQGYVEKSKLDDRTNLYAPTDDGREVVLDRAHAAAKAMDYVVVGADEYGQQVRAAGGAHRLTDAEPADVPGDAEREDGEPVFDGEGGV